MAVKRGGLLSLEISPPECECGEGQAARQDVVDRFPKPGRCHICRSIAMTNKDWPDDRVAAAGKETWEAALGHSQPNETIHG